MHDLSPTPGSYIHHTLGFKCKPLHVFTVIMAFSKCSFILRCIVYIKTRSEKILFGPFFLWLLVNFKALQDYAEKERYFHPLSAIDSFLSPKCFKKITNKRQTNSRQDRWMWSFCFGCCWALPMYFEWVKCWTKCCFHRNTTCDYVCVCMYACMCANVFMLPWNIAGSPQDKMMCIQLHLWVELYFLEGAEDPHGHRCRMSFLTCCALLPSQTEEGCISHSVPQRSLSSDDWLCRKGDV